VAVLVVAGVALVSVQRSVLTESLDETIDRDARLVEDTLARGLVPEIDVSFGDDDALAQLVDAGSGEVVASTANARGEGPIAEPPPDGRDQVFRRSTDVPTDEAPFRVLSRWIDGPDGRLVLHVASTLDDVEESIQLLTRSLFVTVPITALVLGVLVWLLVGRTLRPVESIRAEVAAIGAGGLDRRVPEPGSDDEVGRLARTMNEMLERIETAHEQQRRFVADASHELRSPLTRIRAEIEVDLAHRATADPLATHRSVLEETVALQRLVDDLLYLARSDAGAVAEPTDVVDVHEVVEAHARRLAAGSTLRVDASDVVPVQVTGDAAHLDRAVGNIVENAARYARSEVVLSVQSNGASIQVAVADDGPGVPSEQAERVFERFGRVDEARTASSGGTGLGLAIARDIVHRHGGTIALDPQHQPGARFVITLPRATDP
jgi:signal transduction histidine kinase